MENLAERELIRRRGEQLRFESLARGGIIDQAALGDALNSDQLFGAGIDVFEPEPLQPDNPLLNAKNIVLTPHIAGVTGDSLRRHYQWSYENVKRVLEYGQEPLWVVNGI